MHRSLYEDGHCLAGRRVLLTLAMVAMATGLIAGQGRRGDGPPAPARGGPPPARALAADAPADESFPAHRIAGNLYYVGTRGLAVYLLTSPAGHILINGTYPASVPLVRASVESLGFRMADIKLLLNSHAHPDHVSGNADLKALTGASVLIMDEDVNVIRSGGRTDFQYREPGELRAGSGRSRAPRRRAREP
jgi:glyoxylase-like metal-dependent hydrolase (beta-lactamase superfamily II)